MVNLELYKIFVIVANQRNITGASEILNISQPAVTKHIKNLENFLQTKLFNRSNQGTTLTRAGKELYDRIKEPINTIINIDNQYSNVKTINLGCHSTLLSKVFGKTLSDFYLKNNNVKVNTINIETDKMIDMLKTKELDIVLSKKMDINLNGTKLQYIKLRRIT